MSGQVARTGIALLLLLGVALAVMTLGGLAYRRELIVAAARALVQLIAVALVIAWIFTHPQYSVVYLAVMVVAAAYTANRRIRGTTRDRLSVLLAIVLGVGATVVIVTVTGAIDFSAQALLPFAAQMIGGAMTAASLTGVRLRDDVHDQFALFEGYVALGATYRQAGREFSRRAAEKSLFPALDQTKSAGLVTLPGAFVGLLLGGAAPLLAAQIQLLVLIGLLLVQSITALVTSQLISPISGAVVAMRHRPVAATTRSGTDDAFVLHDVQVAYGSDVVVSHVSMAIPRREITVFIGASGSGKTSVLRCLNRMTDPLPEVNVGGAISYCGEDLYADAVDPRIIRRAVGMVFQRPVVFPVSIYENVAYGPRLHKSPVDMDALVEECLTRAALWQEVRHDLSRDARGLSVGQQHRLAVARCLAMRPEVILLDEPTASLDPDATAVIEALMLDLAQDHTLVLVTHDLRQAAHVADRVAFFARDVSGAGPLPGQLVEFGPADQVLRHPRDPRTQKFVAGMT